MASDQDLQVFVQSRYTDLLRTAYLLTGTSHEAEDLVQGALLRVMRHWGRVEDPLPYVRRAIVNLYLHGLRRRTRELVTALLPERPVRDGTDRVAERSALWPALRALPGRMRAVIVLRYWLDLSELETAQLLGCSIGTVKSTASRGLARLRQVLPPQSTVENPVELDRGGSK
ncbi:MAG TPA: SigE family RNA polymerase sigma factor [Micromonosporaceae bacterium]